MQIVNLTPHVINFIVGDKNVAIQPSGTVGRCATNRMQVSAVDADGVTIPINCTKFGNVTGLPDPQPDTIYVVSALVATAVPERSDVFIVDDAVRDDAGRIIGARAVAHV